ncbi:phage major capsid protein [Orenia marismortui]|uniref:HK97 family phage major capsid protein n=1 Tax=Orenia marismortui TaxID=46469 RepID=A0A4R8H522_9FIRM|nr:phage major capsid protein [Orenia marismortui]TDX52145.1 HK97 family phage major capsid protein [Orenia marismortui]
MKNMDKVLQQKAEIANKLNQAMKDGDEESFAQAFTDYTDILQEAVMAEAKGLVQAADNQVLAGRGVRALTSKENKFYQAFGEVMGSSNPKQAITDADMDLVLPETVIEAVFDDLTEEHPLLDAINFMPTSVLVKMIVNEQGRQLGKWGKLTSEIVKELTGGFKEMDLSQKKLSAFIPVSKSMIDLGPEWLDRYIRTILSEAIANGLEDGIINGTGLEEPVGMRKDPNSALDPADGFQLLPINPLNKIDTVSYGNILADLSKSPNGLNRKISQVLLLVNPVDYFRKIMPATSMKRADGTYVNNVFPFPTNPVQSVHIPEGEIVIGIGNRYFMALGTSKGGRIEYSDEYRFLEDERVYLTKLYGNGKPLDSVSFKRFDISNLQSYIDQVEVVNIGDARLADLSIGSLDLDPTFNKSTHYYTAATTDATNTITATPIDGEAAVEIDVDGTAVDNGSAATWASGDNTVTIIVTLGAETETYTVTVTKS